MRNKRKEIKHVNYNNCSSHQNKIKNGICNIIPELKTLSSNNPWENYFCILKLLKHDGEMEKIITILFYLL